MLKIGIEKVRVLLKRRKNARKLKIKFTRTARWRMPETIFIDNRDIEIRLVDPARSNSVFIDILLDDSYGLVYLRSYLKEVKKIIDIGANQGLFILAARNIFPEAKIHSYEPNALLLSSLEHHSKFARSAFFIEAVGSTNGRVNLQNETGDSILTQTVLDDEGIVPQVAIKECIDRIGGEVDLLKLDCEGAEWDILNDVEALKKVKAITLEYHLVNKYQHNSVLDVLKNANFRILHYLITGSTWGVAWAVNNSYFK